MPNLRYLKPSLAWLSKTLRPLALIKDCCPAGYSFFRFWLVLAGLWWLATLPGLALDPRKTPTQYVHDVWQDELPQVSVLAITQTRDGYLWLGTYEGLVRFDGIRFTVFNPQQNSGLRSNGIFALCEDAAGRLWVGTVGGGLLCRERETFTTYTTEQGLPSNTVRAVCTDAQGTVWIGTENGLCRFENGRFSAYSTQNGLSNNLIRALTVGPDGTLWVGTLKGLNAFAQGKFTSYSTSNGLTSDQITALFTDRDGRLWVGTGGGGLHRFEQGNFVHVGETDGLAKGIILAISEDRDRNLWIGTDGSGLHRLQGGQFTRMSAEDGLTQNAVRSIFEDREGSIWIGTNSGLNRLRDGKFTLFTKRDGLADDYTRVIFEDSRGRMWVGCEGGGLSVLEGGRWTTYTTKTGLSSDLVRTICEDREGRIWIGTNTGLNCFQDGKFTVYTTKDGLSNDSLFSLAAGRDGRIWIGTIFGGLNVLQNGHITVYTTKEGLANNAVRSLYEDRSGVLWVGTNAGLNRFENGKFTTYTSKDGLSNDRIFAFYEDREGALWLGTNGGLNRLKDGKFSSYTTKDGLHNDVAFQILEDKNGSLWMSCNRGVYAVPRNAFAEYDRRQIATLPCVAFGKTDGMRTSQCNGGSQPAGWCARDGQLWFPTVKGVVVIDPNNLKTNPLAPPVLVETMLADEQVLLPGAIPYLDPGLKKFEFHYTALSFLAPEKVTFKYKLEGFDRDWVLAGTRREAYYTNIPPGSYTFKVIACNNDGVWNTQGAHLTFRVRTPLWLQWWALSFYIVSGVGLVWGMIQFRTIRLARQNARLESTVRERTAALQEALTKIEASQFETERKNALLSHAKKQLEEKNSELDNKNRALDRKVKEVAQKNDELVESQKRADRIFTALAEALPGTVLDGKYRLDEKIGAGGFGAVFRSTHLGLNRPVAIKVFRPSPGNDSPEAAERFRREGMTACRINHPNAIQILDSGISSDGIAYLVMELLEGHPLTEELRTYRRLSLKRCVEILVPVCEALQVAHSAGLVHRDIKPDNIFLHQGKDGEVVKVVDFGIAKLVEADEDAPQLEHLTGTGALIGTPAYMSPERLTGEAYDGKADVYSLGIMLYEMLCGRIPFMETGKRLVEVILKHMKEKPKSLRKYNPQVPREVEAVVMQALEKAPTDRPTAQELAAAFVAAVTPFLEKEAPEPVFDPEDSISPETETIAQTVTDHLTVSRAETAQISFDSAEATLVPRTDEARLVPRTDETRFVPRTDEAKTKLITKKTG
ncbi:MAG: protein kinase [Blastocatellia bacterium]|nr:protein kinase [Blastocatellia bacterium]